MKIKMIKSYYFNLQLSYTLNVTIVVLLYFILCLHLYVIFIGWILPSPSVDFVKSTTIEKCYYEKKVLREINQIQKSKIRIRINSNPIL